MPRGRKKGSKNVKTLWNEAEKLVGTKYVAQVLDPLYVIETVMRYFFTLAESRKDVGGKLSEVIGYYKEAEHLASLAAPYRHARLSAVKLADDPNNPVRFKDDATVEELREEILRRLGELREAGLIDLTALPGPKGGIANQPVPGVDQSGINGR
jgi:hypothetical protein